MLLNVSNGAFLEGICLSERFLVHVEALFAGVDELCRIQSEHKLQGNPLKTRQLQAAMKTTN
jgi:hypothetical protein